MAQEKTKIVEGKIDQLIPDDKNMNRHNQYGMSLLERSIGSLGLGRSILVDKNNKIIAGNGVTETAANLGLDDVIIVPSDGKKLVVVRRDDIDIDSKEGRELALADNAVANVNLEWDEENLKQVTTQWDISTDEWGVEMPEMGEVEEPDVEEDDFEIPEEDSIKTDIVVGDLIEIGPHRLICGDSTKTEHIDKLMGGRQADLLVTDPPYNVNYQGGTAEKLKIENDNMTESQFREFLTDAFAQASRIMKQGAAFYVYYASRESVNFIESLKANGLTDKQQLIWVKSSLVLGRQDYQWRHESILYGWKDGAAHYFVNCRSLTTVIEDEIDLDKMSKAKMKEMLEEILSDITASTIIREDKPLKNAEHPTMRPLKLIGRNITNSSRIDDLVVDIFGGSGSTMAAAHQSGRICYMVELDARYCQVIIDRMRKLDPNLIIKKNGEVI